MESIQVRAARRFIDSADIAVSPLGAGHINDSFLVAADNKQFVLQRINHGIFKDVDKLQSNILRVTNHIRSRLEKNGETEIDRKVLDFLPCDDGNHYCFDDDGNYWRMMRYITDCFGYDRITPELARKAGEAFGRFQSMLSDLPGEPLFETIPNFHNMETRLADFRQTVKNNPAGRCDEVKNLTYEIEKRSDEMCKAERMHREGILPKRINHCDTKVNNVLFDKCGNVLCVVDLDTVMPGYVLSDFGDFIRTGANNGQEDDTDLSRVSLNLDIYEAYAEGYLSAAGFLTETETNNLAFGAKLLTYMQTVRFLGDYLNGDTYYKIKHPLHNLERSEAQFALLLDMEFKFDRMNDIIKRKRYENR